MWGNWIGWLVSLVMVAGMASGLKLIHSLDQAGGVTSFVSDLSKFDIAISPSPRELVPADKPGDARALIKRAIEHYDADPIAYERFNRGETDADAASLHAVPLIVEATSIIDAGLFVNDPSKVVTLDRPLSNLRALLAIGKATVRVGFLQQASDATAAEAHYRAAFSLGVRLFDERLAWDEFFVGQAILAESGAAFSRLYAQSNDAANADKFKSFEFARITAFGKIREIRDAISSPNSLALHSGDVLFLASSNVERMWRVESLYAVARLQRNASRVGDATAAKRLVSKLADTDPDPIIKLAATAARDMNDAQYQTSFQQVE